MVGKTLPGLFMALALGLVFCFTGEDRKTRDARLDRSVRMERIGRSAGTRGESVFRLPGVRPAPAANTAAAADSVFGGTDIMAMQPSAPSPATGASAAARATRLPRASFADAASPDVRAAMPPHAYGLTSGAALASLSDAASPALPAAHIPSFAYPALPPKGIAIWGKGMMYKEKKEASRLFENVYSHDGTVYSVGAEYDWSVDSTIGLSADFLQAELTGRYADESRRTDTSGYFINAHYNGALAGKIPFRAKAMYGWLEQDASGWAEDWFTGTRYRWSEEKHDARMFGVSASVIYPLLVAGGYRITPEAGVDYRNLRTKEFAADIEGGSASMQALYPSMIATSLASYAAATISRDFQQVWGVVTPRLSCGYSMESSGTAGAVRALGASAAHPVYLDEREMTAASPRFDAGAKELWTYGVGVDMKVLGGWDISAEYEKRTGQDYDKDSFKLEVGRCF